jgi:hypothetical protein
MSVAPRGARPRRAPRAGVNVGLAALVVVLATSGSARAQGCEGAERRLAVIHSLLRADAHDARIWAWGWGLGFTALAAAQAGLALTRDDAGQRAELFVGAGKTVLGLVPVLFVPVPARRDAGVLEGRLAARAEGEGGCALLPEAELMLRRSADDEAFARSWLAHVATIAVNGGGLLIVGLGYHRWVTGTVGALVGTAVGELQIFTRPEGALRSLRSFEGRWAVAPMLARGAAGVLVAGAFGH